MQKIKRYALVIVLFLSLLYIVLLIPSCEKNKAVISGKTPFAWKQDQLWQQLETAFVSAKQSPASVTDLHITGRFQTADSLLQQFSAGNNLRNDALITGLLNNYFSLAALVAARPGQRQRFIDYYSAVRTLAKDQSTQYSLTETGIRNNLYRLLYGMRAAAEEVLLQTGQFPFPPVVQGAADSSAAPAAVLFGIRVHSGDLLVSRGGAEVSALISRGNDYPGNFSHVALLYVDEKTNQPFLVEAHIEKGVAVSSAAQYIQDKKLRFMVLRPRAGLDSLHADPMLPHKAAQAAFAEAGRRHIPYDFKMDFLDSSALFCSEVASHAYGRMGLQLWPAPSHINAPGVIRWLGDFGVEHFVTQMPSDLEYDPQLTVVAEWRNPETLQKDHLEQADRGRVIRHNHWMLPIARVIKAYCSIKNWFGGVGIIPEGMSATRALKNQYFVNMYQQARMGTERMSAAFTEKNGYQPPYWKMLEMARVAAGEQ